MNFDHKKNLKTKIIRQLYQEYDNICYQYDLKLKKPVLCLEVLSGSWGKWDPQNRTLFLNEELFHSFSWNTILGILKHEMAHQVVHEIFFSQEDNHGREFLRACELLRVPPKFRKASLTTGDLLKTTSWNHEEDALMRRITKLFSLAHSANEHEARAAMEKAQKLCAENHIKDLQTFGEKEEYQSCLLSFQKQRIPSTILHIAAWVQEHCFVQIIFSELYDPQKDRMGKTAEIIGTKKNILMAKHIFLFLQSRLEVLWKHYQSQSGAKACHKLSYQKGLLVGFQNKSSPNTLHKGGKQTMSQQTQLALLALEREKLEKFTATLFPKICKKSASESPLFSKHYHEGQEEGNKIEVKIPVCGTQKKMLFLKS